MITINAYSFRILWGAEDEAYVATCPEFDGVSGLGDSAEDALREARTALGLVLETYASEGWVVPAPIASQEHSGQFRLRIPRSLHARLAVRAADEGVSLNSLVMSFVAYGLGGPSTAPASRAALRMTTKIGPSTEEPIPFREAGEVLRLRGPAGHFAQDDKNMYWR